MLTNKEKYPNACKFKIGQKAKMRTREVKIVGRNVEEKNPLNIGYKIKYDDGTKSIFHWYDNELRKV